MGAVAAPRGTAKRSPLARVRPRLDTTPGRLRLAAVVIAAAALAFGLVAATAAYKRRDAATAAANRIEPLLVQAATLHGSLSDADATASSTFVTGGEEPHAQRRRYLNDLTAASAALGALTRRVDASPATAAAVATIGRELPRYSGLIETARANNRQGFPVGAAYLRQASALMRGQILPAAAGLYAFEARSLNDHYRAGASTTEVAALLIGAALMLALLVAIQVYLARLTHRVFNVPLVAASIVALALTAWGVVAFTREQDALGRAQRQASDAVEVLSAVRILGLRAQADEGLALAARGSGDADNADFVASMRMLGVGRPGHGLLAEAEEIARRTGSPQAVRELGARFAGYSALHDRVVALESRGRFRAAANLAVGSHGEELTASDRTRADLDRLIGSSQARFERAAGDATSAVGPLWIGLPLLVAAGAALALLGLRMRIEEYR